MLFLIFDFALLLVAFALVIVLLIIGRGAFITNIVNPFHFLIPIILFAFPVLAAVIKTITSTKRFLPGLLKFILYFVSSFLGVLALYAMFWYLLVFKVHDAHITWLETFTPAVFMMLPVAGHILLTNSNKKDIERSDGMDITLILVSIGVLLATLVVQFLLIRQFDSITFADITRFIFGK